MEILTKLNVDRYKRRKKMHGRGTLIGGRGRLHTASNTTYNALKNTVMLLVLLVLVVLPLLIWFYYYVKAFANILYVSLVVHALFTKSTILFSFRYLLAFCCFVRSFLPPKINPHTLHEDDNFLRSAVEGERMSSCIKFEFAERNLAKVREESTYACA